MYSKTIKAKFDKRMLIKLLSWADGHAYFTYFNPNRHENKFGTFEHVLFVGSESITGKKGQSLQNLQTSIDQNQKYHVGYFSYELKNEIENLESKNPGTIPACHAEFFIPDTIVKLHQNKLQIQSKDNPDEIWKAIKEVPIKQKILPRKEIQIQSRVTKNEYLDNCKKIREDIVNGEYYELNYCIEYWAENCAIDPIEKYLRLNELSPMPFSCLAKFNEKYVLCASPERFLKKEGLQLVSQPIKGTIRRGKDKQEDQQLKIILRNSQKELAENMMIIDLVRNDLSKSSVSGSVRVEEFFGIYSFKQVHQMISTVISQCKIDMKITDIIRHAFPMGSMTGAPKIRVMQAIDKYENSRRGIYSGSIGYITPEGNMDFNVVIRSIIYDSQNSKLSFHVGSAITYDADPEYEYEECQLKSKSMVEILTR